jgi:hypothetical protein
LPESALLTKAGRGEFIEGDCVMKLLKELSWLSFEEGVTKGFKVGELEEAEYT